jgi:hypothetical protein
MRSSPSGWPDHPAVLALVPRCSVPPYSPAYLWPMAEERACEQCGTGFVPRREHARFCSVPCRLEWNDDHVGDPMADASALQWSITAMTDTAERLPGVGVWDRDRAFAAIGEVVWWVTMVDATLVRHHLAAYDGVMTSQAVTERRLIEGTLAGLRFVRNQIGSEADLAGFIRSSMPAPGAGKARVTGWTWMRVPVPALRSLPPRARAWEMTRYHGYRAQLADRTTGETFGRAVAFLTLAAADAARASDILAHATR